MTENLLPPERGKERPRRDSFLSSSKAGWLELALVFCCAIGTSIGFTATLSTVNYVTWVFDDRDMFLFLCFCVYGPSLPVVIAQLKLDIWFDSKFGSRNTYNFRITLCFLTLIALTLWLPFTSSMAPNFKGERSKAPLLGIAAGMGFCASVIYGSFFQLISTMRFQREGYGAAAFAFGYQGAGFVSLIITLGIGGFDHPSVFTVDAFFITVGVVEIAAFGCFQVLVQRSKAYQNTCIGKDEEQKWLAFKKRMSTLDENDPSFKTGELYGGAADLANGPLMGSFERRYSKQRVVFASDDAEDNQPNTPGYHALESESPKAKKKMRPLEIFVEGAPGTLVNHQSSSEDSSLPGWRPTTKSEQKRVEVVGKVCAIAENLDLEVSTFGVFKEVWPCIVGIFLVLFGSIFMLPFYTYIPGNDKLPQVLFYTKMFSDTLSRPLTVVLPKPQRKWTFLLLTIARLAIFLPILFLYIKGKLGFENDIFIVVVISVFSMLSGFLGTSGYQLAPTFLDSSQAKTTAANMMTLAFNGACVFALVVAFLLLKTTSL